MKRTRILTGRAPRAATGGPGRRRPAVARKRTGTVPPAAEVLARALAPTRGRHRRRHHVLDPEPGAGAAVVARRPAAVLEAVLGQGLLPVLPQEVPVQPGRDVVPGQDLVLVAVAVHGVVEVEPGRARGPSVHSPRSKCSDHSWNVPPARQTCSMTAPIRRSPRLTRPSTAVASGSCQRSVSAPGRRGRRPSAGPTLRRSSAIVFWPNHWNGVWALGTNPPTEAVTVTLRW